MQAISHAIDCLHGPCLRAAAGRGVRFGLRALPVLVLLFALTVGLQIASGAYRSEFGGHPDEAAHFVTGLMVRDYVAGGFPGHPMRFARRYYEHYPKVALGHWPPGFYLVQSVWTLIFSPGRMSILLLMAALTALAGTVLFAALREDAGVVPAGTGAVILVSIPLVQQLTGLVMSDVLVALLSFCAVLCFGRYLRTGRWPHSIGFGLFACMGILTKGTALCLALVPLLGVLISRRFQLLRRIAFWAPAVIVLVVCGPWMAVTWSTVSEGFLDSRPSLSFTMAALPYFSWQLVRAAGVGLSLLAAVGIVSVFVPRDSNAGVDGKWAAIAAFGIGVMVFLFVIPCGFDQRYVIPALFPLIMFAVRGAKLLGTAVARVRPSASGAIGESGEGPRPADANGEAQVSDVDSAVAGPHGGDPPEQELAGRSSVIAVYAVLAVTVAVFLLEVFRIPKKAYHGFGRAADVVLAASGGENARSLVSSDARGEGMFVAEFALRDRRRPGHVVRRASKALASSTWIGTQYESRFEDVAALVDFLRQDAIRFVVLDGSVPENKRVPHHGLLERAVDEASGVLPLIGSYPVCRGGVLHPAGLAVYEFVDVRRREGGADGG